MKRWGNVAVGYLEHPVTGASHTVVALSEKASSTAYKQLKSLVDPTAELLLPRFRTRSGIFGLKGFHAEDYILSYARKNGFIVRGIGSDNGFCPICIGRICNLQTPLAKSGGLCFTNASA